MSVSLFQDGDGFHIPVTGSCYWLTNSSTLSYLGSSPWEEQQWPWCCSFCKVYPNILFILYPVDRTLTFLFVFNMRLLLLPWCLFISNMPLMLKGAGPSKGESLAEMALNSSFQTLLSMRSSVSLNTGPKQIFLKIILFQQAYDKYNKHRHNQQWKREFFFWEYALPFARTSHGGCFQALLPTLRISRCWTVLRQNVLLSSNGYMKRKKNMVCESTIFLSHCQLSSPSS